MKLLSVMIANGYQVAVALIGLRGSSLKCRVYIPLCTYITALASRIRTRRAESVLQFSVKISLLPRNEYTGFPHEYCARLQTVSTLQYKNLSCNLNGLLK